MKAVILFMAVSVVMVVLCAIFDSDRIDSCNKF